MSEKAKETRFLEALEDLFTGAEVEGDSGFINLMRMKRGYFKSVAPKLMEAIDDRAARDTSFREELFDKLYTFFSRYFCESGSIYFRCLPAFAKTYERVYDDGEDVALSWKTRMLYYVKSDVLVRSMPVRLEDKDNPQRLRLFHFDASDVEHKKNNERREFVFAFSRTRRTAEGPVVHLKVSYSQRGRKTDVDGIVKKAKNAPGAKVALTEDELRNAFRVFRRQTEADYFINKDARGFLREQFDMWMYQYLFHEETVFEQERLRQLQAIRQTAYDVIDFIAQFEDEVRRAWEKPKFVRDVNYVVTLDKLPAELLAKIVRHKGTKAQVGEWRELGMVDGEFSMDALGEHRFLPLDTRYFKDLELEILDALGNLDEALDGELVHSENWQALNTLRRRYRGRVKCIHVDPPYNTKTSGFLYQNEYRHSSWLTMMENRVNAALELLSEDGSFLCHIDENEYERLHLLFESFSIPDAGTVIWDKRNPMTASQGIAMQHEYVIWRSRNVKPIYRNGDHIQTMLNKADELIRKHEGITNQVRKEYASWVNKHLELSGGEKAYRFLDETGNIYRNVSLRAPEPRTDHKFFQPLIHPGTGKPCAVPPNGFSRTPETLQKMIENGEIIFGPDHTTQPQQKRLLSEDSKKQISSVIQDARRGKADLDLLGLENFPYCHSVHFYIELVGAASDFASDTVLDYFAGSGTTAHAVINLNREDGGNRKYLLVEMGDYFHTVLLPRIKKVVYSNDWKDGKPVSKEGISHFLKYYALEQYEETLKKSRYEDGKQLEIDSTKSPFEQYVFFGDDKLAHAVKPLKNGKLKINLLDLYSGIDIAESLSNVLGKPIRCRTADVVTFADGTEEKIDLASMTEEEKRHFVSLIKPYLWWGE